MQIILATHNKHKVIEIQELLKSLDIEIISLTDLENPPHIIEDGDTFKANALKKAKTIAREYGLPAIADDSGIQVDYLKGEPGIYSARFAGENATDTENNKKLMDCLEGVPFEERKARYACAIALARNGYPSHTFSGTCTGYITTEKKGAQGFGYDPLFYFSSFKKTFAEIPPEKKNSVSHRYQALKKLKIFLEKNSDYFL